MPRQCFTPDVEYSCDEPENPALWMAAQRLSLMGNSVPEACWSQECLRKVKMSRVLEPLLPCLGWFGLGKGGLSGVAVPP